VFDEKSRYIEWKLVKNVVEQLNNYYDTHGRFPDKYTGLVECPEPNGTLCYMPDGRNDIHQLSIDGNELVITVNVPDSLSPQNYHDWTDHEFRLPIHRRFRDMVRDGEMKAPTLHRSERGYVLDIPVDIPETQCEIVDNRVLSVDLGVKKQATCTVVQQNNGVEQIGPPVFLDHPKKNKLFRLKNDAEGINDRLGELRRQGKGHTKQFDHLLSEYRQTCEKERRLRHQIQHHVANELVWTAVGSKCETIVFESLGDMGSPDSTGGVAWSISSWAHGDLFDLVEYKAEMFGIETDTVDPWGTSRYCPRCGERGQTVKAPDDHTECRHGGHFHCRKCGYECDRDVVGALNVGRKHLSDSKMEKANPAAYTEAGKHASFPSPADGACSTGVQSTVNTQDSASGRQTQLPHIRSTPLTVKCGETDMGGLRQNHGRNTGLRKPSRSITAHVLASTTD